MTGRWARAFWVLASAVACGCGGGASGDGDTTAAGEEAAVPSPPSAWASMSHDARAAWMMEEVMPRMEARFASFDEARYAGFGCGTCHGADARERGFAMPSPSLPALYPTGAPEQRQMVREYPEMVRFMFNDVLPTMQTLLAAPDYDEATGEGFSCYACHPHAGDPGTTPVRLTAPPTADAADAESSEAP